MMIVITAKTDGFRRCGIAHPGTPTQYPDERFTTSELEQLKAEPMLVVTVQAEPKEKPKPAAPAKDQEPNDGNENGTPAPANPETPENPPQGASADQGAPSAVEPVAGDAKGTAKGGAAKGKAKAGK